MRDFKGMKRQRGRNRGNGGNLGKPQQQNANRAFESNGPEGVKARGNAQTVFEKYQQLARDATTAGDRVLAENFLQHAEHYFRVVRAMQPTRPASEILGRDQFSSGFDIDFEDESGAQAAAAADALAAEQDAADPEGDTRERPTWRERDDRPREERPRDDRPRDERPRDDRPRDERPRDRYRDDRPRNDRPRDDRPRDDRPREDRSAEDRPRSDRYEGGGRRDRWRERDERPREDRPERDPLAVVEPRGASLPVSEPAPSAILRDDNGGQSLAPDFLKPRRTRAPAAVVDVPSVAEGEADAKPVRRRRAPTSVKGSEGENA